VNSQGPHRAPTADDGVQQQMQYAQEMAALFQIGIAITSGLTVQQVLQSILDECRRILPIDTLYVALYDAESDSYEIPLFFDLGKYRSLEQRKCQVVRSLTCDVIALRSSLYIPDLDKLAAVDGHVAMKSGLAPTHTYLGVPMLICERVIGVISIQSLQIDAYNASVIQLLETIAMQAAVAVENARLYEATKRELAERKELEEQLRVTLAKYTVLFDTAPVGISITDARGQLIECNPEAEDILGISQNEHLKRTYDGPEWQIVRPDGTPMPGSEYASVRAFEEQRRIDDIEMGIVHGDGSIRWISVNAAPIPLEGHGVVIAYTDVTERKRAENELRQSEQRYRLLAENVQDAVWVRDLQGNLIYASPSIARLWGYSWDELTRRSPEGIALSSEAMSATRQRVDQVLRAMQENQPIPVERFDLPMRRSDGEAIVIDVLRGPLVDDDGNVVGFRFAGRDVTETRVLAAEIQALNATLEQRVAERTAELSAALSQLQRADRMKDEFLATMSHELRTPLTVILGAAEAMAIETRGPLNDQQKRQVQLVAEGGGRLLKMVNDLLRYANLAAGKTTILHERCSLAEVGSATVHKMEKAAVPKQQVVTCSIVPPELVINSDSEAIMNMLDALLDNAVKFTPAHGHITLEIAMEGADTVRLDVSDDGIGIAPEKQRLIFQPFVQGDSALNRAYEGSGIGLAYVARMAEALGGSVKVESELGHGSRFTIKLPTG